MQYITCLAGLLDLSVDWDGDSVRLGPPAPCDLTDAEICKVPNVIEVLEDGTIRPINYELRDDDGPDSPI